MQRQRVGSGEHHGFANVAHLDLAVDRVRRADRLAGRIVFAPHVQAIAGDAEQLVAAIDLTDSLQLLDQVFRHGPSGEAKWTKTRLIRMIRSHAAETATESSWKYECRTRQTSIRLSGFGSTAGGTRTRESSRRD